MMVYGSSFYFREDESTPSSQRPMEMLNDGQQQRLRRQGTSTNYAEFSSGEDEDVDYQVSDDDDPEYIMESEDEGNYAEDEMSEEEEESPSIQDDLVFESEDEIPLALMLARDPYRPDWNDVTGSHKKTFPCTAMRTTPLRGILMDAGKLLRDIQPIDVYSSLVTDDILNKAVQATNLYAAGFIKNLKDTDELRTRSRYKQWTDIDLATLKKFLGLVMHMGISKRPEVIDHWSTDPMKTCLFCKSVMPRDQFLNIQLFLHFTDPETNSTDRLDRVRTLISDLENNFIAARVPGADIVIDESQLAWRGRLVFRMYNPFKTYKYGIKIYKL